MPYQFTLPKLTADVEEGVVVAWFKREGSDVRAGERLLEVQLAKVSYEVVSPISGKLYRIVAPRDTVIRVDQSLAILIPEGEAMPVEPAAAGSQPAAAPAETQPSIPVSPAARRLARERGVDLSQVKGSGPDGRVSEEDVLAFLQAGAQPVEVRASPLARRLAQENGIDLAQVRGSGTGGRITEEDVRAAMTARAGAAGTQVVPLGPVRRTIARRMTESLHSMAQVTLVSEVDVTDLVGLRQSLKEQFDLTYTDLVVKAVALSLKDHPYLNARLEGEEIQLLNEIHIGIAVSREAGLIVPVIRNVDRKSLQEIARESKALAERARAETLSPEDATGGTFTVTNLGTYGVDAFTPIIDPPQVAVLGVGRIREQPARQNDGLVWRQTMTLSLTFDHRIVDGAPAAAFLQTVGQRLEHPQPLVEPPPSR